MTKRIITLCAAAAGLLLGSTSSHAAISIVYTITPIAGDPGYATVSGTETEANGTVLPFNFTAPFTFGTSDPTVTQTVTGPPSSSFDGTINVPGLGPTEVFGTTDANGMATLSFPNGTPVNGSFTLPGGFTVTYTTPEPSTVVAGLGAVGLVVAGLRRRK